jgi:hypothetical protein
MRRMVKENLLKFDATPLFPERIAYTVSYRLSNAEAQLYKAVTDYVRDEFNRAEALENDKRAGTVGFALTILQPGRRCATTRCEWLRSPAGAAGPRGRQDGAGERRARRRAFRLGRPVWSPPAASLPPAMIRPPWLHRIGQRFFQPAAEPRLRVACVLRKPYDGRYSRDIRGLGRPWSDRKWRMGACSTDRSLAGSC